VAALIGRLQAVFAGLPDVREMSNNRRYEIEDAASAAFAVFFTQSPSFLDSQIRMHKARGRDNAATLFGIRAIPCDNQIRKLLDPVPPESLFPFMADMAQELRQQGLLEAHRALDGRFLIALDGTDFFSSQKISCPNCSHSALANGKILHRHIAVTPVLVAPGQEQVIALPPQFVQPQDGHAKQDCELAAAGRWLDRWGAHYAAWGATFLGDDLYCHQPFCQRLRASGAHFVFTCKPESHRVLYEWVGELDRLGRVSTLIIERRAGKQRFIDRYRFVEKLPLRDGKDAMLVNWCELTTTGADGTVLFKNAWATSHSLTRDNVAEVAAAGRARWKIENENNNTLKTKGYHFDHNFGHGKQHLANLFATMILLAFLFHTALDLVHGHYRAVRQSLPSRRTFFEHFRALIQYIPFDHWDHLFEFMLDGLGVPPVDSG
jgi:hypothetical protein